MAISNFSAISAALGPSYRRTDSSRYVYIKDQPNGARCEADGTIGTGADTAVQNVFWGGQLFHIVPEQTNDLLATAIYSMPQAAGAGLGKGLLLPVDAADNDGVFFGLPWSDGASLGQGTLLTSGKGIFVGRTDGFFIRVKLAVADVSETDELAVFVRKVQAMHLTAKASSGTDGSTDIPYLNVDNGTIKIGSHINTAVTSVVSTTQTITDTNTVTLEIRVSESGYVKFLVNGAAPTVDVTNFQFDADNLHCGVSFVSDAAGSAAPVILEWEQGLLTERGLDGVNDLVN